MREWTRDEIVDFSNEDMARVILLVAKTHPGACRSLVVSCLKQAEKRFLADVLPRRILRDEGEYDSFLEVPNAVALAQSNVAVQALEHLCGDPNVLVKGRDLEIARDILLDEALYQFEIEWPFSREEMIAVWEKA